ncbi:MAG: hypothetical protein ACREFE_04870 [Limisphaerales bacterium]
MLTQSVWAQVLVQPNPWKPTNAQKAEIVAMMTNVNCPSLAWHAVAMQRMVAEANFFADRLHLPTPHPIQISDVVDDFIARPWFGMIQETNPPYWPVSIFGSNIYNTNIPREARLRALEFGPLGRIDTTNFDFGFGDGGLSHVMRLSAPQVERYAHNLDDLVGKPSLIDTNGAYQLATQWLAAVDIDMAALRKLKWTVNQLHYKAKGATNYVTLPLYYVDFGNKHFPASGNLRAFDEPLISVEILGTTKELQNLMIHDLSFSCRPLLLITNTLDLVRTPNPPLKQLKQLSGIQTNSASP